MRRLVGLAVLTGALLGAIAAAPSGAQQAPKVDAAVRKQVIDGLLERLRAGYVFPETAAKMEAAIREREKRGEYDTVTEGEKLAQLLTDHMREVSRDKHLGVMYSPEPMPESKGDQPSEEERAGMRRMALRLNCGFEKVERLQGNIGYLELRGFVPADLGAETAAAAMTFLANTDALIIDLRRNGGGEPDMVALMCSYLLEKRTHLNDLYFRPQNTTEQYWSLPHVAGKRYLNKDVYLLTSKETFSAAEEFAYNLKNLKRATIVGETTGGGAHPGDMQRLSPHFAVFVPNGRAINPITKTNWEGTGVAPDLKVAADRALTTAHLAALKKLQPGVKEPGLAAQLQRLIERLEKEQQ
jgi:hypothetical protein